MEVFIAKHHGNMSIYYCKRRGKKHSVSSQPAYVMININMAESGEGIIPSLSAVLDSNPPAEGKQILPINDSQVEIGRRRILVKSIVDKFMVDSPETDKIIKDEVVRAFAQAKVLEEELDKFTTLGLEVGLSMASPGQNINLGIVGNFTHIADSLEKGKLYQQLTEKWKTKFLVGLDRNEFRRKEGDYFELVNNLLGATQTPRPPERNMKETADIFDAMLEVYDYIYSLPKAQQNESAIRNIIRRAQYVGLRFNDLEQIRLIVEICREVPNDSSQETSGKYLDSITSYVSNHGVSREAFHGLVGKLLPAMQNEDPQVKVLLGGGNIWGMGEGHFGIGDFVVHAYALGVTPAHINELLTIAREVPSTDLFRFEQNRLDALTLEVPFGTLRDYVHNQEPYVHDIIEAMVKYYDNDNNKELLSVLEKVDTGGRYLKKKRYWTKADTML